MTIYSLTTNNYKSEIVEVEVTLAPGTPQLKILGLPDSIIKEGDLRIKSALRKCGFSFPSTQQVIVNLKPSYIKKKSEGMDLAIALSFLIASKQWEPPSELGDKIMVFGELSLEGECSLPNDVEIPEDFDGCILLGGVSNSIQRDVFVMNHLAGLGEIYHRQYKLEKVLMQRPNLAELRFSKQTAHLLELIVAGEHSVLLAGPAGSGKSTVAESVHCLRPDPPEEEFRESKKWSHRLGHKLFWRPIVQPHHSIPPKSMIGGGTPMYPGEITRAHGGTLVLDELLEFQGVVRECLREPIEKKKITVARQGRVREFPADFLLVATTNLCPCGDFVPGKPNSCRFSLTRCRSYLDRLSGPIADRFQVMSFDSDWQPNTKKTVGLADIKKRVDETVKFRKKRGQILPNGKLELHGFKLSEFIQHNLLDQGSLSSRRRRNATVRVARTIADMERSLEITPKHIGDAKQFTQLSFERLKKAFS